MPIIAEPHENKTPLAAVELRHLRANDCTSKSRLFEIEFLEEKR